MTRRRIVLERGAREPSFAPAAAPVARAGEARLRTLLVGLDGTDVEVLSGDHGAFPTGEDALVLGHECLAEVVDAPDGVGLAPGDRVVPLVRHGCGRCAFCAHGRSDVCATGLYTEHGIRGLHGFLRDEWTDDPASLVRVPGGLGDLAVLAEPLSVVMKAIEVSEAVQRRVPGFDGFRDRDVLLAGTGSLGALAAFALTHLGARVHAIDRSPDASAAPALLAKLGVAHSNARETPIGEVAARTGGFDLVLEATGSPAVAFEAALALKENGVMCLLGVPAQKPAIAVEADDVVRALVLKNAAVVGSVNASAAHVALALERLARFRERWPDLIEAVVTHRFAPEEAVDAFRADGPEFVKKVVDFRR